MRVRTDDRRKAILDVATDIFREVGYARASMAMIAARLGGSKGTLYGYFKSKDDLFAAAMMAVMEGQADDAIRLLDTSNADTAAVLQKFGDAYLELLTTSDALAIMRTAIAKGSTSKLGPTLYELGAERAWDKVAAYLGRLQEKGILRQTDPRVAAAHLKGLLETGIIEPQLFGAKPWFETKPVVGYAIEAFLRAYACNGVDHPNPLAGT